MPSKLYFGIATIIWMAVTVFLVFRGAEDLEILIAFIMFVAMAITTVMLDKNDELKERK